MNTSVIRYLLGYILKLEGFCCFCHVLLPVFIMKKRHLLLIVALISIAIGFIFRLKPRDFTFRRAVQQPHWAGSY